MIKAVHAKTIAIFILIIFAISIVISLPAKFVSSSPNQNYTILIDAGHGGIDGGSTGVNTGVKESDLNLEYALALERLFKEASFNVVMTRTTKNGLYNIFAENKKKDDMKKRQEIIYGSGADLVISIHMNSFSLESSKGAQVFYKEGNISSKALADSIQENFVLNIENARPKADKGDYFILNCSTKPSVIVECGFLSNPKEESKLLKEDYREKLCYNIFAGALNFLTS